MKGVISQYNARELGDIPLGVRPTDQSVGYLSHPPSSIKQAQIMSSNPELLGLAAHMLFVQRKAPRVDLNCGCPANTVTGNGAGSSLLRTPEVLRSCVEAMVAGAGGRGPISVKMRYG